LECLLVFMAVNNSPEGAAYIRTGREPCLFAVTTIVSPEGAA